MASTLPPLTQQARYIRLLYIMARQRFETVRTGCQSDYGKQGLGSWDGGYDRLDRWHKPIWPRLVEYCRAAQLDPALLVQAAFWATTPAQEAPQPNQLMSEQTRKLYDTYCARAVPDLAGELELERRTYTSYLREFRRRGVDRDPTAAALDRRQTGLSALFVYCQALQAGYPELAQPQFMTALWSYLARPRQYDQAWGDFLPAELKQAARQYLDKLGLDEEVIYAPKP